jgi:hypothetical protein
MLAAAGVNLGSWSFATAGVSADGRVLVGQGQPLGSDDGRLRAVLITLP